jgi:molybdate transport system ATP-binding protein
MTSAKYDEEKTWLCINGVINSHQRKIDVSFAQPDIYSVVGDSGAGKSSLLKAIAGWTQFEGSILLNGVEQNSLGIEKRVIKIVSQQTQVFPHLNVLQQLQLVKSKFNDYEQSWIDCLDLTPLFHRKSSQLSGGERMRLNLMQALLQIEPQTPHLLLLDEITAALQPDLSLQILAKLKEHRLGCLMVSHRINEHQFVSSTVINAHTLQTESVASWLGKHHQLNVIPLQFKQRLDGLIEWKFNNIPLFSLSNHHVSENTQVLVSIAWDQVVVSNVKIASSMLNQLQARVTDIEITDSRCVLECTLGTVQNSIPLKVLISKMSLQTLDLTKGQSVYLSFKASALQLP